MARAPRASKKAMAERRATLERAKTTRRTPEIEIALGARIRIARLAAGRSQGALGEAVGISFQQVQKYEKGRDRVSASTLQGIAAALGVHPGSFFDGDMPAASNPITDIRAVVKLGQRIQRVRDPAVIKQLFALVDVLADALAVDTAPATDTPETP